MFWFAFCYGPPPSVVCTQDKHLLLMHLQLGGSPNGLPNKGGTALHRAVHMKRVVITKILIEHEADLTYMVCTHGGLPQRAYPYATLSRLVFGMEVVL